MLAVSKWVATAWNNTCFSLYISSFLVFLHLSPEVSWCRLNCVCLLCVLTPLIPVLLCAGSESIENEVLLNCSHWARTWCGIWLAVTHCPAPSIFKVLHACIKSAAIPWVSVLCTGDSSLVIKLHCLPFSSSHVSGFILKAKDGWGGGGTCL